LLEERKKDLEKEEKTLRKKEFLKFLTIILIVSLLFALSPILIPLIFVSLLIFICYFFLLLPIIFIIRYIGSQLVKFFKKLKQRFRK